MLLFSTILDIDEALTKEKFVKLIIEWNQGSLHQDSVILDLKWHDPINVEGRNDKCWLKVCDYSTKNIVAARYEKNDESGAVWDTDFVMNFDEMRMSIQLDRGFTEDAIDLNPKFSIPYFVTLLIDHHYIKRDDRIPVLYTPHQIDEAHLDMIADIINGDYTAYKLPIVYVSKTGSYHDPVDTEILAERLKGVAHILVQKNVSTNKILRQKTNDQNEYFGAIGIYYPNKAMPYKRFLYHRYDEHDEVMMNKVIRNVILYCNRQKIGELYTWPGVINAMMQNDLKMQNKKRQNAENEREEVYNEFDEEINKMQKSIDELTDANRKLRSENIGLKNKIDDLDETPIITAGSENDLYSGEIKDIVLSILKDALENKIEDHSRRHHVVSDLIENNNYQAINEKKEKEIKRILYNYTKMTKKIKRQLEDFGFEIKDDGKHYKLIYYKDSRYQDILAKTPSDGRGGKNNALDIKRRML